MVSNYMPDVVVEIAWDSGYVTPAASRTWTDVSDYVELADGIDITFGRQDELSTADANDLTLTLDNSDGRFTALRSGSPYYPNVKIGRPIRVKVTPPGGSESVRFVGFIDEWPVEWDGSDAYAKVTILATSRMARLGLTEKLKSMIEEQIPSYSPARYYTMGDPSGSTAAVDSSGNAGGRLLSTGSGTAVVFGEATGPGTDGLTAATFAAGQYLTTALPATAPHAIHLTVKLDALPGAVAIPAKIYAADGDPVVLAIEPSGVVTASHADDTFITGPNLNDGATHDVTFTLSNDVGDAELFVDGLSVGTETWTAGSAATELEVGRLLTGVLSHVAYFDANSSPIESLAAAAMAGAADGFVGERTDQRLLRILEWVGVASAEVDAETGDETMTYQQTSGASAIDMLRECESTEGGVLFDGPDGEIKFHNRSHRYLKTAAAILDAPSQHVGADYAPRLDRSTLANDITVDNPTTGESARAVDTASSNEYGVATSSATSVADSYEPLGEKAAWLIASYAEPRMRVPSLTVDVLAHQGLTPSAQTLLGITVGDVLGVESLPTQAPEGYDAWDLGEDALGVGSVLGDGHASFFVEGYTETIGPESYEISFNLSPTSPALDTFILDDADRGTLDSDNVLAY
jgi:hypothetical protein